MQEIRRYQAQKRQAGWLIVYWDPIKSRWIRTDGVDYARRADAVSAFEAGQLTGLYHPKSKIG